MNKGVLLDPVILNCLLKFLYPSEVLQLRLLCRNGRYAVDNQHMWWQKHYGKKAQEATRHALMRWSQFCVNQMFRYKEMRTDVKKKMRDLEPKLLGMRKKRDYGSISYLERSISDYHEELDLCDSMYKEYIKQAQKFISKL